MSNPIDPISFIQSLIDATVQAAKDSENSLQGQTVKNMNADIGIFQMGYVLGRFDTIKATYPNEYALWEAHRQSVLQSRIAAMRS
jgi:hypothetical protein